MRRDLDQARTEDEREQIVPYLAAHSNGAGDDKSMRSMLVESARIVDKYGSQDVTRELYEQFVAHESLHADEQDVFERQTFASLLGRRGIDSSDGIFNEELIIPDAEPAVQWAISRQETVKRFLRGDVRSALYILDRFGKDNENESLPTECLLEMETLRARCLTELGEYDQAEACALGACATAESSSLTSWHCLALNTLAILYRRQGRLRQADEAFHKVGAQSLELGAEMQIVTSANLSVFLRGREPKKADEYRRAALKLAGELQLHSLGRELNIR